MRSTADVSPTLTRQVIGLVGVVDDLAGAPVPAPGLGEDMPVGGKEEPTSEEESGAELRGRTAAPLYSLSDMTLTRLSVSVTSNAAQWKRG